MFCIMFSYNYEKMSCVDQHVFLFAMIKTFSEICKIFAKYVTAHVFLFSCVIIINGFSLYLQKISGPICV